MYIYILALEVIIIMQMHISNPAVFWLVRNKNEYCVKDIFKCFLLYFVVPNILGYSKFLATKKINKKLTKITSSPDILKGILNQLQE